MDIFQDAMHGLRSGDIYCVMHYDNSGLQRDVKYTPEPIGFRLCKSSDGTGYNTPANKIEWEKEKSLKDDQKTIMYFGETSEGRGNCIEQIRISGRGPVPDTCGNRIISDKK